MVKPLLRPEKVEVPLLDDVALLVGTELEHQGERFRVECIASWLYTEGLEGSPLVLVLRKSWGMFSDFYVVSYEELLAGGWTNLGLS